MKAIVIRVFGKVQHVGYRFTAMQVAYQVGIKGFIENQKDKSLYIEAEGDAEPLEKFVDWCKKGPVWSKVDRITVDEGEIKNYTSFDVR